MNYEIEKQYDPELDCCLLLHCRYATRPPQSMVESFLEELSKDRGVPLDALRGIAESAIILEQHIAGSLSASDDDLKLFFPGKDNANGEAGIVYWQLRRRGIRFSELAQEGFLRERNWLIAMVAMIDVEKMNGVSDLESLITVLEESQCTDATLRICLRLWKNPAEYQARFDRLLDDAVSLYKEKMDILPIPVEEMFRLFREKMQDPKNSLRAFMESQAAVGVIRIVPSPFLFNTSSVVLGDMDRPDVGMVVIVGIWEEKLEELLQLYDQSAASLAVDLAGIADQKRMEILGILRDGPQRADVLCSKLSLSPALLSYHMNQLCQVNAAIIERSGRSNIYSLNTAHLRVLVERMTQYFHLNEEEQE